MPANPSPDRLPHGIDFFVLANQELETRRVEEALELYNLAESRGHPTVECAAGRWKCRMLRGEFELAWRESDLIAASPDTSHRFWDGLPFKGKSVLIRTLHGYGDAIQFIRYAALVRQDASRVTVQTHPALMGLLAHAEAVDRVVTWPDAACDGLAWDQQVEAMELPWVFRTTLDSIPAAIPYLRLSRNDVIESRHRLKLGRSPRIGMVWSASDYDPSRSISLEELSPLFSGNEAEFYSFQHGPKRGQVHHHGGFARRIRDTAGLSATPLQTAADVCNMDLIIGVDTFVSHLAGALGRPVWLMLPYAADWRWMLEREDSPWYPKMRLFRQPRPGEWSPVVQKVASELSGFLESNDRTS